MVNQTLKRVLIIGSSDDLLYLIKFCIGQSLRDVEAARYAPAQGRPGEDYPWRDYHLVILELDLGLGSENGFDWLEEFAGYPYCPPTLVVTSYGTAEHRGRALRLGAVDYLDKHELSPSRFSKIVTQLLESGNHQAAAPSVDQAAMLEKTQSLHGSEARAKIDALRMESSEDGEPTIPDRTIPDRTIPDQTIPDQTIPDHTNPERTAGQIAEQKTEELINPAAGVRSSRTVPEHTESMLDPAVTVRSNVSAAPSILRGGQVGVPGYRIIRKIAEGGQASIYLAEHEEDGEQIVLKVLYILGEADQDTLRRFMREYKLISRLQHPNVVRIFERAFSSNFAYIAMEYFPDGDLKKRIKKGLSTDKVRGYMRQIVKGIGAAHELGIVHRDIKPGNILFREDDSLAVTDFGLSKALDDSAGSLTRSGSLLGTFYYISPEQIKEAPADFRSDLYSVGMVFYQMLTGTHPFRRKNASEILRAHIDAPVPSLPEALSEYQPIIDGLLAKDPDERFQTTQELLVGLNWGQ